MREKNSSYEWVTLKKSNIRFVSELTGRSMKELSEILEAKNKKGVEHVRIPIGTNIFRRDI